MHQVAIGCQEHTKHLAAQLIKEAAGKPILRSYSSDGTPMKTAIAHKFKLGMHKIHRVGMKSLEYLLRVPHDACHLAPPIPLTNGKHFDTQFASGLDFGPSLREVGHPGYSIEHCCFDRCGYDHLPARFKQQHQFLEKDYKSIGPITVRELKLTRWDVKTACSLHDTHTLLSSGL